MRLVESVVRTMRVAKVYTDNQVTNKGNILLKTIWKINKKLVKENFKL